MKKLSLFLLCCSAAFLSWAQTREVTGRITSDSSGLPLGGVSVQVKGSKVGTTSNDQGDYKISVPAEGKTLVFSFVGYNELEKQVGSQSTIDVSLATSTSPMNDVVVIGYQSVRRRDLTGTVSSMSGAQIEKVPVSNLAEALVGRMAGVQVTSVDGQPGSDVVIRVRGGGSLTGSNDPLYIVDGFRVNNINDIATTDIASVDILKDAATAAIYGAAGANGVVIITTKSAKGGKTSITYNGYATAKTFPRKLDVLSPYEFVLAQYEYARLRSQTDVDNFSKYFGVYDDLELYKAQKGTDWQEELFGNPAWSQQHNLSITGGNDKTKYSLNYTYNKDVGILPTNNYQRNYVNFKLNHALSNKLKLDFGVRYSNAITMGAGTAGGASLRISDGIQTRPVNGIADQINIDPGGGDAEYEQFLSSLVNPLELAEQDYRKRVVRNMNYNAAVSWSIIKPLTFRSELSYGTTDGNNRRYYGPLTGTSRNEGGNLPMGEITQTEYQDYRWSNTLAYNWRKDRHDLNVIVGQELLSRNKGFEEYNRAKYFAPDITPEKLFATMGLGTQDIHTTAEVAPEKLASFFGRAIYQFDKKYIFNFTARYDGSTKFAPGKQWGFFPAGSVAWRMTEEDFMQSVGFLSDLKLRVSYGSVGNNNIGNDLWRVLFGPSSTRPYGAGDVINPYYTYATSQLPNPDIRWETTITRNIGLDFAMFKSKLTGTLDFYHNTTKDLLVESAIPQTTGFATQQRNIGQTSNKGVELSLNYEAISTKDFQLSLNFNVGMNRSNIDQLDGVDSRSFNSNWAGTDLRTADDYRLEVGKTLGLMYGYVTDGMYTVDDFESYDPVSRTYKLKPGVASVNLGGISLRPGTLKLKDLNNDGLITAEDDRTIIGSALPKATGGFGLNAKLKNFDLGAFFNWTVGNDVYNTGRIQFNMLYRTTYGSMLDNVNSENRFRYTDPQGNLVTDLVELAKLNPDPKMWSPFSMGTASPWFHSYAVEDGSFLRLNTLTLGYNFPKKMISKLWMTNARIYATVYNAFIWTSYSGYDPEVSTTRRTSYSQLTPGVDYSAFPKSRNFTAGVNVTF